MNQYFKLINNQIKKTEYKYIKILKEEIEIYEGNYSINEIIIHVFDLYLKKLNKKIYSNIIENYKFNSLKIKNINYLENMNLKNFKNNNFIKFINQKFENININNLIEKLEQNFLKFINELYEINYKNSIFLFFLISD